MSTTAATRQRSFRDPGGFVFRSGPRLLRAVEPTAFKNLENFLASRAAQRFLEAGQLVSTEFPDSPGFASVLPPNYRLVEHEVIEFASFPAEWPPEMLAAAGFLTLELAEQSLPDGWRLKDATPYNVLFRGPNPVFVDVLSFEPRDAQDGMWAAYAQFVRTFLLPLLAKQGAALWLEQRDGLEPEQVYRSLSWFRRLTPPGLMLASFPTWFAGRAESDAGLYRPRTTDPERAAFTLQRMFQGLRRQLRWVSKKQENSQWSQYLDTQTHYTAQQFAAKESFVSAIINEFQPRRVLDVGCNTGHFSELAALGGASVVAIDSDATAAGRVWRRATDKKLDILPLVVDLCRPTPAVGWRNRESSSFLDRAMAHQFDMVMMLAVVHHMLVTERVPLEEILDLATHLTTNLLLIEFVEPSDPMFRRLVRGRDALYAHLTASYFEAACAVGFEIIRKQPIENSSRTLYLLRRRI